VKGILRNPDGKLRASQFVRARVVWRTTPGIIIPVVAVLRISGQFFAFVAEDAGGKLVARQRAIKVGPIVGDDYRVLDGLKPNDRVIVSGVQKLADGAPIAPQP
jgi:multidrug efflux pump subunit AcrA (membrane-fusion protein)